MDSFAQEEDYIKFDFSDEEIWKKVEENSPEHSNPCKGFFQKTAAKMEEFFKKNIWKMTYLLINNLDVK